MKGLDLNTLFHFHYLILGNHSLYVSFDTLENFTLMQGYGPSPFQGLVQGRVKMYYLP